MELQTLLVALILVAAVAAWRSSGGRRLPPGPKRWPLLGSFLSFPRHHVYDTFSRWQKVYGDVAYLSLLGQPVYIINTREKAEDLLGKRGHIHSHRPVRVFSNMMGWEGFATALLQPGKLHSEHRSHILKGLSASSITTYDTLVQKTIEQQILARLANRSEDPEDTITRAIGSTLVDITYGNALSEKEQEELHHVQKLITQAGFEVENQLINFLLDIVPSLQYLPAWFPGAGFQHFAARLRGYVSYIRHRAFETVLEQRDKGVVHESLVSRLIEINGPTDTVRDSTAFLYTVGKDTTAAAVLVAIYALLMYPEIQEKAHTELDLVVGPDHPPSAEDRIRLPYLEAIWKECIRWRPPVPLVIPHVSGEDDIWEGYWIPKGSFIFANVGFMLRDERIWDKPELFYPERFLDHSHPPPFDPLSVIFGFGRRVCPGKYLADREGFQILASILWAFRIDPIKGETRPRLEDVKFVDALVTPPLPFRCHFNPRNVDTAAYCNEDL